MSDERHREPPWALPRASRGDPEASRRLRRGGARGAGGLRGAAAVPEPRDGMAAQRARTDPAAQGRHRRRRGGLPGRAPRRLGAAAGALTGASGAGRVGRGGRRDPRRAGASRTRSFEGSRHRTPNCSGRPCSTRMWRSSSRPATSAEPVPRPTSCSGWPPDSTATRWSPRRPWPADACGSRKVTRRRRNGACRKPRDCGTRSGRPMRQRAREWSSQRPSAPVAAKTKRPELQAARKSLDRIEAAASATTGTNVFRREGDYWSVAFDGGPCASAISKGSVTSHSSSPTRAASSTCSTWSPRERGSRSALRRRRRDARRARQDRLPPPPRGDRRRHRAGARPRGRCTGGASRRRA